MFYKKKKRSTKSRDMASRSICALFLLISLVISMPYSGYAQTDEGSSGSFLRGASTVKSLEMAQGASETIILPRDAKEVFVSDPVVIDAVARNARTLFIIGKGAGRGTIVVSDKDDQEIMTINLNVGRDVNILRQSLKTAVPTGEIDFTVNDSTIILTGFVDSANDAITAQDLARTFFRGSQWTRGVLQSAEVINSLKIRGKEQVMIKVTIAEVQRSVAKAFGSETSGQFSKGNGGPSAINSAEDGIKNLGATLAGGGSGGVFTLAGNNIRSKLEAFERNGVAKTLAEPTLVAISGETAKFKAGGQVAVKGDSTYDGGRITQLYTYKDVGVKLEFTPMVLSEGRISIKVKTEVTEIDSQTISESGAPSFKTREQETTIELPSGASMVTAGLIQQRQSMTIQGVPGLMSIPILGSLFRSSEFLRDETELMIIVTPYLAKAIQPDRIVRPTDGLVFASDPQSVLLGRINKIYGVPNKSAGRPPKNIGHIID